MSYPTLPWVQGAKFCNNVLGNFIISAPHMALMTELQTLSCINILKKYYLHKPSHFSAVQQDLRRWVTDKIVMTMAGSHVTGDTGDWAPVVTMVRGWHRSRRSEWPDKPLIITALLSAIVSRVVTSDQSEARFTRLWPIRGQDCGDQVPLQYRAPSPRGPRLY